MTLLTYSNKTEGLDMFRRSAEANGWNPTVLGAGCEHFTWEVRLRAVRDSVLELPSDELVVFTDAFDVLLLGSPDQVKQEYDRMAAPIVFSAETNCWPMPNLSDRYPAAASPFRFLNAGTYMGRAQAIISMMEDLGLDGAYNLYDQLELTKWFLGNQVRSRLDTGCRIFQCLYGADRMVEMRDGRLFNKETKTLPMILHANGNHHDRRTAHWFDALFPRKDLT